MACHNVRGEDGPCDCAGCRNVVAAEVARLREANASAERTITLGQRQLAEREAEVARLRRELLDVMHRSQEIACENEVLQARVRTLEALPDQIAADAKLLAPGETFKGGPLHGASVYNVMMWAERRIRAALRGGE